MEITAPKVMCLIWGQVRFSWKDCLHQECPAARFKEITGDVLRKAVQQGSPKIFINKCFPGFPKG